MQTVRGWKLFRLRKDGSLGPLFINRRQVVKPGVWYPAESHPTKGYTYRPFWHAASAPVAPHLSERGRVWREVLLTGVEPLPRPKNMGGMWYLAKNILVLPKDGEAKSTQVVDI